jgi:hypothetical protein
MPHNWHHVAAVGGQWSALGGSAAIMFWAGKFIHTAVTGTEFFANIKEVFRPRTNGHTKITKNDLKMICPINHKDLMAEIREDNRKNYESLRVEQREDFKMLHEDIERMRR